MVIYYTSMVTTETKLHEAPSGICCPVRDIAPLDDELLASAAVFKALSDPTRLRIMKAISHVDEACECNIVPEFGLTQPTISYHLRILREAGLIASERRGQWVWHRVNQKAVLSAVRNLAEIAE
jgi:ArsR family transcriptional regulator